MMPQRFRWQIEFIILIIVSSLSPAAADDMVVLRGDTMGTTYTIKVRVGQSSIDPATLQHAIDSRLDEINRRMSTYIADSEVSRFNRAEAHEWFPVSNETLSVISLGQEISRKSSGAFDITVSPLVKLWNFGAGRSTESFKPPTDESIRATLKRVGFEKLEIQLDPPAIRKSVSGLAIDLSAIAKGFAVDSVAAVIDDQGAQHYMVEIGGEIRVRGATSGGLDWGIGIEAADKKSRRIESIIGVTNTAIASSGDYRDFHEYDGQYYSHTIDPRTGRPIRHDLAAVTVLASSCATADALATALMVLGTQEGKSWAESQGYAVMFLSRDGDNSKTHQTSGFISQIRTPKALANPDGQFGTVLVASIVIIGIALACMSVGVLVGNRRIQGSCGGIAGLTDESGKTMCDMCTRPSPECQGEPEELSAT